MLSLILGLAAAEPEPIIVIGRGLAAGETAGAPPDAIVTDFAGMVSGAPYPPAAPLPDAASHLEVGSLAPATPYSPTGSLRTAHNV